MPFASHNFDGISMRSDCLVVQATAAAATYKRTASYSYEVARCLNPVLVHSQSSRTCHCSSCTHHTCLDSAAVCHHALDAPGAVDGQARCRLGAQQGHTTCSKAPARLVSATDSA